MRRVPLETDREITPPKQGESQFRCMITGTLRAEGAGPTEEDAHRVAEQQYDRARAELVREGEDIGREALLEQMADVLYCYHHAVVIGRGAGLPPGTALPQHADPTTMSHFRNMAELWLGKTRGWREQTGPAPDASTANARGIDRR